MLCKCQDSIILNVQKYLFFVLEESNINVGRTLRPAVTGIIVAHWSQDGELSPRHVGGEHTDAFIYTSSNQLYQSIVDVFSYPGNTVVDITPDSTLGMFCSIIILFTYYYISLIYTTTVLKCYIRVHTHTHTHTHTHMHTHTHTYIPTCTQITHMYICTQA